MGKGLTRGVGKEGGEGEEGGRGRKGEGEERGWGDRHKGRVSLQDGWVGVSPPHPFQFPDRMLRNMKKVCSEMDFIRLDWSPTWVQTEMDVVD
jgi:hypothetical protein